jgi:hypothetical protein
MSSMTRAVNLIRLRIPDGDNSLSGIECQSHQIPLVLHQPDEDASDRLLGICQECGDWFLINTILKVAIRLPDDEDLRCMACSSRGPSNSDPPRQSVTNEDSLSRLR